MLRGRHVECEVLDRLVDGVRAGESQVLVLRGEAGVGKTALLNHLVENATGCRVVRAAGVQSEMELAFAGLHQLCTPLLDQSGQLPGPQASALRTALGLSSGPPPDRFLVGLAALGLTAEVARSQPLVCVVDDAQWLDRASVGVLAFIARRLVAEAVALVFAARGDDEVAELSDLTALAVEGLQDHDARALLRSALPGPIDERVLDQVVSETRGNPLALLELPHGLTAAELAGVFGAPGAQTLPKRIEDSYRQRVASLPQATRQLLLIAAAEPLGDSALVWRAAMQLGITPEAAAPAALAGLFEIGARVRFRHPLVRSAVYRAATAEERRVAHSALTAVTGPALDAERRAWHCAQATSGRDEDVACKLVASAGRAQARGGLAAAAAFLERAAELTPDRTRRMQRTLDAARARHQAGTPDAALGLLSFAEAGSPNALERAQVDLLRAQIAFTLRRGRDAPPLLLSAARQLETLDVRLARETYLEALDAARFAGRLGREGGLQEAAEAARNAPPAPQPSRPADLLLDGLATRLTDGYAAGAPLMKRALAAFRSPDLTTEEGLRWLWLACRTAGDLWDDEASEQLATRHVRLARDAGALTVLPLALASRAVVLTFLGELTEAAGTCQELEAVVGATGHPHVPLAVLLLAAWQGREENTAEVIQSTTKEVLCRGEGVGLTIAGWAEALLCNSLGRYDDALAAAREADEHPPPIGVTPWGVLVELVEAGSRTRKLDYAHDALDRLAQITRAAGTGWALGIEARSRALLSTGSAADDAYREAIDYLGGTRIRGELARAHLLYGEWLRRERRRLDARNHLRTAHDMFAGMGAEAFTERAARELQATGETVRKRNPATTCDLTPQESQIIRLTRDGLSNAEIAARLFISSRTVEWHLSRIFNKLGISSRRQL